ncbi:MAG: hypothetical protein QOI71_2790 [Gaiellales bacterium]|nr:hypothetical protein [Gaiellales bacterium]
MTTTVENGTKPVPVEEELLQLQREEHQLEERTDRLSLVGGLTMIFSILALIVGITALTVALIANGKGDTKSTPKAAATSAPAAATPATAAIAAGKVDVKLGEMFVRPNATVVKAGKVTFTVANTGTIVHEMIISRTPVTLESSGKASEAGSVGEVPERQPGTSGKVTVNLKAGSYQLFCNVPGHYAAGQHANITVKD